MKELLEIFYVFFKMSAVTFGGGYAMLPILQREIVDKRNWISHEEIIDYYAISQGLPGIIAVNVSIFIGRRRKGNAGGIAGALGIVAPCLLIITLIAVVLNNFHSLPVVRSAFSWIAVCVATLIFDAVIKLWKKAIVGVAGIVLFATAFVLMGFFSVSPVILIVSSAIIGVFISKKDRGHKQ